MYASQISVSDKDHVWGVNSGDYIYRRTGDSWQQVSGRLKVVSVGQSGVWGVNSNDDIFYRTGTYGDPDTQGTGVSKCVNCQNSFLCAHLHIVVGMFK